MRLEVPNRIVVIESKSLSEFDRRLLSDSDSNDESESTFSILIWIWSYSVYFQLKSIFFDIFPIKRSILIDQCQIFHRKRWVFKWKKDLYQKRLHIEKNDDFNINWPIFDINWTTVDINCPNLNRIVTRVKSASKFGL